VAVVALLAVVPAARAVTQTAASSFDNTSIAPSPRGIWPGAAEQRVTVSHGRRLLFEWPARAGGIRARLNHAVRHRAPSADPPAPQRS